VTEEQDRREHLTSLWAIHALRPDGLTHFGVKTLEDAIRDGFVPTAEDAQFWLRIHTDCLADADRAYHSLMGVSMSEQKPEKMTDEQCAQMLSQQLNASLPYLRADTVDWFLQRVSYLLDCASKRIYPES